MEKKVRAIAEYLGANENEMWSEISKLLKEKLQNVYSMYEGQIMEHDITKAEFSANEDVLRDVAEEFEVSLY